MDYTNEETWIGKDFQGWPICKRTFKELFEDLNLVSSDGSIHIPVDHPILKVYPTRLQDDGAGYGIEEEFFVCASFINGKLHFFTEPFNQQQVDSLKEEHKIYEQKKKEFLASQNDEYDCGHNIDQYHTDGDD